MQTSSETPPEQAEDEAVDAIVTASRAMIAVAVRSLSGLAEDITIAQYRTLVVLASRGPQKLVDLAGLVGVTPSTAGRMCDRLLRRGLVIRRRASDDRRAVRISLTPAGRGVVDEATRQRRAVIAGILSGLPAERRRDMAEALRAFAAATGEVPDDQWPLGPVEAAGTV
jgi:DNA-binding MarR family transcriptional regulator